MQLLTAEIFILMINVLRSVQMELTGREEHTCAETRTFFDERPVKRTKPHEIKQTYKCWDVRKLFKCERTFVLWQEYYDVERIPRKEVVYTCCNGYIELRNSRGKNCVPNCSRGCINGDCVAPDVCFCSPGFYDFRCGKKCPEGLWGRNCENECKCSNNGECDSKFGCVCQPGWMGERCQSPCQEGYYGHLCKSECSCDNSTCNHETGECLFTTEAATDISTSSATSDILTESTIFISDTTQSLPTLSTEVSDSLQQSVTEYEISTSETVYRHLDSSTKTEENTTEEESIITTIETAGTTSSEVFTIQEMTVSEVEDFESEITGEKNLMDNKMNYGGGLKSTDKSETVPASSTILPGTPKETKIIKNKTNEISFTASKKDADKNETNNFISEGRGNSSKETIFEFLHFLPSLSVLSAVSFLIIIIAARWVIVSHKRRTRMLVVVAEKESIFQSEERVRFQAENLLWINNCTVNPVYLSDVDLNNATPILETFKPVDRSLSEKGRTAL